METKHTPFPAGPYEINWRRTKRPSWELRAGDSRILTSSSTILPEGEIEALGRLLKAAPDLLAAIEALRQHDSAGGPCDKPGFKCECFARADAAIAKARGEGR